MDNLLLDTIKIQCNELIAASKNILAWQWDSRFGMALAQFSVTEAELVQKTIQEFLGFAWTHEDAVQSPKHVQEVIAVLGGIMPGQILFTSDPESVFLLGAWWPWNNGKTVSIRIAFYGTDLTDEQENELTGHIQSLLEKLI